MMTNSNTVFCSIIFVIVRHHKVGCLWHHTYDWHCMWPAIVLLSWNGAVQTRWDFLSVSVLPPAEEGPGSEKLVPPQGKAGSLSKWFSEIMFTEMHWMLCLASWVLLVGCDFTWEICFRLYSFNHSLPFVLVSLNFPCGTGGAESAGGQSIQFIQSQAGAGDGRGEAPNDTLSPGGTLINLANINGLVCSYIRLWTNQMPSVPVVQGTDNDMLYISAVK